MSSKEWHPPPGKKHSGGVGLLYQRNAPSAQLHLYPPSPFLLLNYTLFICQNPSSSFCVSQWSSTKNHSYLLSRKQKRFLTLNFLLCPPLYISISWGLCQVLQTQDYMITLEQALKPTVPETIVHNCSMLFPISCFPPAFISSTYTLTTGLFPSYSKYVSITPIP